MTAFSAPSVPAVLVPITTATPRPSLAAALPFASEFMLDVLHAASAAPFGALRWMEINRLAARWLRPAEDAAAPHDTSRLGHALVLEMEAQGLLAAVHTTAADGRPMVERVLHARMPGVHYARDLAA